MKNLLSLLLILFLFSASADCQTNPRIQNPDGIIFSLGGPGLYGSLSYEHFISSEVNIEIGSGIYTGFAGIKYHFGGNSNKNWTPYLGGYGVYLWIFDFFDDDDDVSTLAAYLPIGIQYTGNGRFSFAIEAAALVGADEVLPFGSIKLGYRL